MAGLSRRTLLALAGAGATSATFRLYPVAAAEGAAVHGLSAFGDLKYGPGFTHFDYANPDAPKGGTFNFSPPDWQFNQGSQTFDTLNSFVLRGSAPMRMDLTYDALMVRSLDEPDAIYGQLAESVTISPDGNVFSFRLRPQARFHDGSPVTAEDIAHSYALFKTPEAYPSLSQPLRELVEVRAVTPENVELVFSGKQSSRAILNAAIMPVMQKSWFAQNAFSGSVMEAPPGSGPWKAGRFEPGVYIEYDRVADHWGKDLPVYRGLDHFDRIRIDYYRDRVAAFEAFKKGITLFREEFTSKIWATEYGFPAVLEGKVKQQLFDKEKFASMQAWAVNTRRPHFSDARVRRAIGLCFDFEWTREKMFYGAYERSQSLFTGSDFEARGLPSPEELALLEPWRSELAAEAFGEPIEQPVSDGSGRDRKLLGQAVRLLKDAGWTRGADGLAVSATGEKLALELLVNDEVFVRVDSPFVENMRAAGIDATIRLVDASQYEARVREFDFDMVSLASNFGATPTAEALKLYFSSAAAEAKGSQNLPGTQSPAIDALIDAVGRAKDRKEVAIAMRSLDRVLRARQDWIPNWHAANHRTARWDMFGFAETKPDFGFPVERLWWVDEDKARAIGKL